MFKESSPLLRADRRVVMKQRGCERGLLVAEEGVIWWIPALLFLQRCALWRTHVSHVDNTLARVSIEETHPKAVADARWSPRENCWIPTKNRRTGGEASGLGRGFWCRSWEKAWSMDLRTIQERTGKTLPNRAFESFCLPHLHFFFSQFEDAWWDFQNQGLCLLTVHAHICKHVARYGRYTEREVPIWALGRLGNFQRRDELHLSFEIYCMLKLYCVRLNTPGVQKPSFDVWEQFFYASAPRQECS